MVYTVYDLPQVAFSVLNFCRLVLPYVVCYCLWFHGYIPTVIALVGFISLAPCCTFVRTFIVAFCTSVGLISAPLPSFSLTSRLQFVGEVKEEEEDLWCVRGITGLRVCPEAEELFESFSQFGVGSVRGPSATAVPYFAKTPLAGQRLSLGLPECGKVTVSSSPIKESTLMEHDFEMATLVEQFDAMHLHDNAPVHIVDHMTPAPLHDEDLMSVDMPLEGDSSIVHIENASSSSTPSVSDMELDVLSFDDHLDTHDLRHTVYIPFAPLWSLDWSLPVELSTVEDTHATDAMQVDEVFIILNALRSMLPSVDVGESPVWSSEGDALDVPYSNYPFEHTPIVTSVPWVWSLPLLIVEDTMIDRDVHLDALSSSSEGDLPSMPSLAFEEDTPMMRPGQEGDASTEPTISREEQHTANYQSLLFQTPFVPSWSETESLRLVCCGEFPLPTFLVWFGFCLIGTFVCMHVFSACVVQVYGLFANRLVSSCLAVWCYRCRGVGFACELCLCWGMPELSFGLCPHAFVILSCCVLEFPGQLLSWFCVPCRLLGVAVGDNPSRLGSSPGVKGYEYTAAWLWSKAALVGVKARYIDTKGSFQVALLQQCLIHRSQSLAIQVVVYSYSGSPTDYSVGSFLLLSLCFKGI
ncbi:hypothetical protein BDA99DRAFT_575648 [Phascolomyces articulosus]|uniref:Uncharacterized protein n=1 Tax=Phascolomyces articulosus TaxID=60185 RepID=A0AAD5K1M5_9FUNG|nr:hypothetical protein BDA99DRAFT_575648 [Phascolomyces articulosus]